MPAGPTIRLVLAIAVLAGCGAAPAADDDGRPAPVRYVVTADWAPASRTLSGTQEIALRNDGPGRLPAVWLRLWPNNAIPGQADGCRDPHSRVSMLAGAIVTRRAVACSAVRLGLDRALEPGETTTVRLRFTVRVRRVAALFGRSDGIDLLGRALPVLAVRDDAGWHLDPDTAIGDPAFSLAAAWQATISVPRALRVASTGVALADAIDPATGRRVVVAATPHARDFGLAVGRLSSRSATVDGVRVRVHAAQGRAGARSARALRHAVAALRSFGRWFGPYGSPELDVVLTRLGDDSQELPEIVFSDADLGTVAHEVAHQWFYATVGNDQHREPWLDESFAAFGEEQLVEGSYPCDTSRPLRDRRGQLALGLSSFEARPDAYYDVVYRGGACALRALEQLLGRERLMALLRTMVDRHRFGVIRTGDFVALLAETDPAVARRWTRLVGLVG